MEYLDIVDSDDKIAGRASKEDIYDKKLRHRIVHIIIFNNEGKMALQMRGQTVTFCPNHWCTAVGGHVQSGETYEQAAVREYQEELGTTSELTFLGKDKYEIPNLPPKFLATFTARSNGSFEPDPTAVSRVDFFTMDAIREMITAGEPFHPELLFLLKQYFPI